MGIKVTGKDLIKIANSDDVFGIMQRVLLRENKLDREKEHFWLVGLNTANKMLFVELVSIGGVKSTTVEPMNVFRMSILKGAVKVILVHNHPSGEVIPSDADIDLTDRLIQAGKIIDIDVVDHLVISENTYLSFSKTGRMKELQESTKWVPAYELIERVKKQEAELRKDILRIAKEKGEKQKAMEIAKEMKKDNEPVEKIIRYTGLSKAEIGKL